MAGRPRESEESPDSLQQWRRVTPAWGNPRESATENKLLLVRSGFALLQTVYMWGTMKKLLWPANSGPQKTAEIGDLPSLRCLDSVGPTPKIQNVRAEDYSTPEKYLQGAAVPTYYQFQSNMVAEEDYKPGMLRMLEVDKRLTVPTRTHIRFLVTGQDVIHSWAVPSLGIKADGTPGRITRINAFIQREGVFYGQCSELCGALHGFMPIVVEAVSPETYAAHARKWYKE